jgi:hypothetical protein
MTNDAVSVGSVFQELISFHPVEFAQSASLAFAIVAGLIIWFGR